MSATGFGSRVDVIKSDPDFDSGDDEMRFRLTYEGQLLGASRNNTRANHKHEIRKVFHRQLRRLWDIRPGLDVTQERGNFRRTFSAVAMRLKDAQESERQLALNSMPRREWLAENFTRNGYRFVPIVTKDESLVCGVSILFMSPDMPGGAVRSGDIDNRIKTLFDAMRMANSADELGEYKTPQSDENPFYCLLEDDCLIDRLEVETDLLLEPIRGQATIEKNDARIVISVSVRPTIVNYDNLRFASD